MTLATLQESAAEIVRELQSRGFHAYFAGGCVRDRVMGIEPADYDVATDARPEDVAVVFGDVRLVGAQFGVVLVSRFGHDFEVATFRVDGPYSDGRHPDSVRFATAEDDVRRRDFTINGLLYDPVSDELIDLVDGRADIEARVIRAIGDPGQRFAEDRLRMLRAVRFACRLDFEIDPATWKAIKDAASAIKIVAPERIGDEIEKILTGPHPDRGVDLVRESGLLQVILPGVADMVGVDQPPNFHPEGDVFTHTLLCLSHLDSPTWPLALATLLHDVGKPGTFEIRDRIRFTAHEKVGADMADEICRGLRTSNAVRERVVWLIQRHLCFKDARRMKRSTLRRLFAHEGYDELLELHRVDCLGSNGDLDSHAFCIRAREELGAEPPKPPPLVNGRDLMAMGLTPGPVFGRILRLIEEEQLNDEVHSRDEALERARALAREIEADGEESKAQG